MKNYLIMLAIVLTLALAHLFIFTGSISLNYDLVKLKVQFQKLYQENRGLNCLLARGEALDRVESASAKMGMVYPGSVNYIVVSTKESK
jgi:hypothetical protein